MGEDEDDEEDAEDEYDKEDCEEDEDSDNSEQAESGMQSKKVPPRIQKERTAAQQSSKAQSGKHRLRQRAAFKRPSVSTSVKKHPAVSEKVLKRPSGFASSGRRS